MDLRGKFGMSEMESAATIILNKLKDNSGYTRFSHLDFKTQAEMVGFTELLSGGWLTGDDCLYNGQFKVTPEFIKRIGYEDGYSVEKDSLFIG